MTLREFVKLWPSMLIGCIAGLLIVPLSDVAIDSIRGTYDDRNPVIIANGTLVAAREDWAEVAIIGDKRRACIYVAMSAYSTDRNGLLRDSYVSRVDMPSSGTTRPLGTQTLGVWRIWPVLGATSVQLWITHQCEGRLVRTMLAEIELPKGRQ